jgi:hypothetical protein
MSRRRRVAAARGRLPGIDAIHPETPLRLDVAAAIAYPDGSMTASGLRREHKRGRLIIERTAGKDYTTLAHINTMRDQCRIEAGGLGSTCVGPGATRKGNMRRSGSSGTEQIGLRFTRYCRRRTRPRQVSSEQARHSCTTNR